MSGSGSTHDSQGWQLGAIAERADLFPDGFNRVAQSIILSPQGRDLARIFCPQHRDLALQYLQSVPQIGVLLALRDDLMLLFLDRFDDRCEQFAVGNAVGPILVVFPFDQRNPVLGFRPLDRVVQRCRQGTFKVFRNKAIASVLSPSLKR
jgi:hypothetical protein